MTYIKLMSTFVPWISAYPYTETDHYPVETHQRYRHEYNIRRVTHQLQS